MKHFFSSLIIHKMHIYADEKKNNLFLYVPKLVWLFAVPVLFFICLMKIKNKRMEFRAFFLDSLWVRRWNVFIKIKKTVMVNKW